MNTGTLHLSSLEDDVIVAVEELDTIDHTCACSCAHGDATHDLRLTHESICVGTDLIVSKLQV